MSELNGYLNIYKEKGMTSHDVVFKARQILHTKKIGHTGTLDPNAQGVLVLCVGKATKAVEYLNDLDKVYEAEILFGQETDTCDCTGTVTAEEPINFTGEEFLKVLESFRGDSMQVPPIYSALKINGRKLYDYARAGEKVEIPPRPIHISRIEAIETVELPRKARFIVECSKGTYIRSLCRDIGKKLGTAACMGDLYRKRVGDFRIENALHLSQLKNLMLVDRAQGFFHEPEYALEKFRMVTANEQGSRFLRSGNRLYQWNAVEDFVSYEDSEILRLYDQEEFVGIGRFCAGEEPYVQPIKMF
ncbi:tRNA pseudouridine(55) synthase TruB [Eubacterium limosum]|uniref:tRNA pseudouridine synthase B n=1 Tax=Eubacterium limosum TaxID=1736 RepID=A0ABT5UR42_EUBLI|nr:tRNA pseudouridine(55) synthase TruB [Eubacterium limosum]MCB6568241.1 tRNA pseudouridine(55) synthase TruB [Eubacterium limosum]MDE1469972.1 tRNA pseudouridine(55) synthase TruB [Eubacterium limosum]